MSSVQVRRKGQPGRRPKSCTECNRRKVRCNGKSPCEVCIRRGTRDQCVPMGKKALPFAHLLHAGHQFRRGGGGDEVEDEDEEDYGGSAEDDAEQMLLTEIVPLFMPKGQSESAHCSTMANVRQVWNAFRHGWNWMYEVVGDDAFEELQTTLHTHSLRHVRSAPLYSHMSLLLAVLYCGIQVSDCEVSCALFAHRCPSPHVHDRVECRMAAKEMLESMLRRTIAVVEVKESPNLSMFQAVFIHFVCCRSEGRRIRGLTTHNPTFCLFRAVYTLDWTSVDREQERLRLFWNLVAFDRGATLKMLSSPVMQDTAHFQTISFLPKLFDNVETKDMRRWRYTLIWFRARMAIDTTDVCRAIGRAVDVGAQRVAPYSTIEEAARRIQLSQLQLPAEYQIGRQEKQHKQYIRNTLLDSFAVRTRHLVAIVYFKALENVHRLALTDFVYAATEEQRRRSRLACVDAARRCVEHMIELRGAARNNGDSQCIWHMNMPGTIVTLAVICAMEAHERNKRNRTAAQAAPPVPVRALQSIGMATDFLEAVVEVNVSWKSLKILDTLHARLQRLFFQPIHRASSAAAVAAELVEPCTPPLDVFGIQGVFSLLDRIEKHYFSDVAASPQPLPPLNVHETEKSGSHWWYENLASVPPMVHSDYSRPSLTTSQSSTVDTTPTAATTTHFTDVDASWFDDFFDHSTNDSPSLSFGISGAAPVPGGIPEDPIMAHLLPHLSF